MTATVKRAIPPDLLSAVERFKDYLRVERNYSPHTLRSYESAVLELFRHIETDGSRHTALADIRLNHIRNFVGSLYERGGKPTTISNSIYALRAFFRFCKRQGWVATNPARLIPTPKQPAYLPMVPTESEVNKLCTDLLLAQDGTFTPARDRAALELLYATGARVSELVGLDVADIAWFERMVTIRHGKGKKQRAVPFGGAAEAALKRYLPLRAALLEEKGTDPTTLRARGLLLDDIAMKLGLSRKIVQYRLRRGAATLDAEAVFLNDDGRRLTARSVGRLIKQYAPNLHPHSFRHAAATHMRNAGADLAVIQELLGHASLSTTQKYTHLSIRDLIGVYDKAHPRA